MMVRKFLLENKSRFDNYIKNTECHKWTKWQRDNSINIFPCVCPIRNKECIFIEIYYEVQKVCNLIQKEQEFLDALKQYYKIKHNKKAIFEWIKCYELLGNELLHFNPIIKIKIKQEPYEVKNIVLPESELHNLLKFKNIFTEYYYSNEYENF